MTTQPITTALFDFLRDLRENNDREWFAGQQGPLPGRGARPDAGLHRRLCRSAR